MKIAIPLESDKKNVCVSFGRAPFFLFYDDQTDESEIAENFAAQATGGAGTKAAQFTADKGTGVVITVRCGENAAAVLKAAGIKIYRSAGGSAEENIKAFSEGKLSELDHFHAGFHGIA